MLQEMRWILADQAHKTMAVSKRACIANNNRKFENCCHDPTRPSLPLKIRRRLLRAVSFIKEKAL